MRRGKMISGASASSGSASGAISSAIRRRDTEAAQPSSRWAAAA
jgi:hypothetical protein